MIESIFRNGNTLSSGMSKSVNLGRVLLDLTGYENSKLAAFVAGK